MARSKTHQPKRRKLAKTYTIQNLPKDSLQNIFSFLDLQSWATCLRVCKEWNNCGSQQKEHRINQTPFPGASSRHILAKTLIRAQPLSNEQKEACEKHFENFMSEKFTSNAFFVHVQQTIRQQSTEPAWLITVATTEEFSTSFLKTNMVNKPLPKDVFSTLDVRKMTTFLNREWSLSCAYLQYESYAHGWSLFVARTEFE